MLKLVERQVDLKTTSDAVKDEVENAKQIIQLLEKTTQSLENGNHYDKQIFAKLTLLFYRVSRNRNR